MWSFREGTKACSFRGCCLYHFISCRKYNAWASDRKKTKVMIELAKAVMKDATAVHMEYSP